MGVTKITTRNNSGGKRSVKKKPITVPKMPKMLSNIVPPKS